MIMRSLYDRGSFVGRFVDEGIFVTESYAELERALVLACGDEALAIELDRHVSSIFRELAFHIGYHSDPGDVYRVTNLDEEELGDLQNRAGFVFGHYFHRTLDGATGYSAAALIGDIHTCFSAADRRLIARDHTFGAAEEGCLEP